MTNKSAIVLAVIVGFGISVFVTMIFGLLGMNSDVTNVVGLGGGIGGGVLAYRMAKNKPTGQEEIACPECHLLAPHHLDHCSLS